MILEDSWRWIELERCRSSLPFLNRRKTRLCKIQPTLQHKGPKRKLVSDERGKHLCPTRVPSRAYDTKGMGRAGRARNTSPRLKGQRCMRSEGPYISTLVGPVASWHDNLIPPHKDAPEGQNTHFLTEEVSVLPMGRGLPRRRVFCPRSATNMDSQTDGDGYEHWKDARRTICALCHRSTWP
jgi:hypothetical protein